MSRPESHEYHFPPGLPINRRSPPKLDQHPGYISPFNQQDRHPSGSSSPSIHPAFGNSALSRSNGLPEQRDQSVFTYEINKNQISAFPTFISRQTSPPSVKSKTPTSTTPNPNVSSSFSTASSVNERENQLFYRTPQPPSQSSPSPIGTQSTLLWGELEPWMDEEYAKQVCGLKGWDPVNIKVPLPGQDQPQSNNPGYCFLTFPTRAHAAAVLKQVNGPNANGNGTSTMPNSTKPFSMSWAGNIHPPSHIPTTYPAVVQPPVQSQHQQYQKEYSIFVGDLAPETSNSDLVAVFRNPVLGLRADREPKFIRPFLSCKSAKIMLDPATGVSRGYGFVRFTDEADQQRALIEMHGLYCLSRPMRISPATAKFKPPLAPTHLPFEVSFPPALNPDNGSSNAVTLALQLPDATQAKSVSAPIAATNSNHSLNGSAVSNSTSGSSIGGSHSTTSLSSGTASSASISTSGFGTDTGGNGNTMNPNLLSQLAQQFGTDPNKLANLNLGQHQEDEVRRLLTQAMTPRYQLTEESLKHHVQARAILSNLIGPNGEQLTSTDPYNTTVFVGGLSPLISEETLRTFFAPFGDIHYVKVPVGKHCGFVQFVRKADAERAIEKMQGFPIGGSRIRLSWGRSQYKAAQAAAQASQAAALQGSYSPPSVVGSLSQDQALQILQRLGIPYPNPPASTYGDNNDLEPSYLNFAPSVLPPNEDFVPPYPTRLDLRTPSHFSPFSPDPTSLYSSSESAATRQDLNPFPPRFDVLPHPSKAFAPGFFSQTQDVKVTTGVDSKLSPAAITSARPTSAKNRFTFAESTDPLATLDGILERRRHEAPISRPTSGQMALQHGEKRDVVDGIHDLNGTLASLDLDRPWRSPPGQPFC